MSENTEVKSTKIRPNIANMVKAPGGSFHKNDFVGNTLSGLTLDQVKEIAAAIGLNVDKYGHLNNGQQRMTLGNQIRKLTNGETGDANLATVENLASQFKAMNEKAAADAAAAKEAVKAAKAQEKAEKEAAKKAAKEAKAKTE